MKEKIEGIHRRWRAESFLLEWSQLPPSRKERVIAEFEETSRQLTDDFPELSHDIHCALDALEAIIQLENLRIPQQVVEDVNVLLNELDRFRYIQYSSSKTSNDT